MEEEKRFNGWDMHAHAMAMECPPQQIRSHYTPRGWPHRFGFSEFRVIQEAMPSTLAHDDFWEWRSFESTSLVHVEPG